MKRAEWAWISIDIGNSAFATTILAALFPAVLPTLMSKEGIDGPLGLHFDALTLWSYCVSFSVAITLFLAPVMGRYADQAHRRKPLFIVWSLVGIVGTFCLAWATMKRDWAWALFFFVLSNIGFVMSNIFCNSLLSVVAPKSAWHKLSLKAYAWGYLGGGLLLAAQVFALKYPRFFGFETSESILPLCFVSVAVWWLIFLLPTVFFINAKDSLLQNGSLAPEAGSSSTWNQWIKTFKEILGLRSLGLFMLSFALFNEGIQTVISMSSIYGKEVLGLATSDLIQTFLIIQLLGFPASLMMNFAIRKWGAYNSLVSVLLAWMLVIVFALTMKSANDFMLMGVSVALILGISQALPRSIFQSLIPHGRDAEFYSFLALSGKMTSVLGPFLFGFIRQVSGDSRLSLLSLLLFFIAGLIVFLKIDKSEIHETS